MATSVQSGWAVRLPTLVLWALAAGSCVFWGLKVAPTAASPVVAGPAKAPVAADPVAVGRLLGATAVTAAAAPGLMPAINVASRFNLLGVVSARSRQGAALIAVDGKPPRPFRVGAAVDEGLVLQSVDGRRAVLAASAGGPPVVTLELPPVKR